MIYDGDRDTFINHRESAVKYIAEVEIPTCLNLAHCYLKLEEYDHTVKYTSQALVNEPENVKALYRRGVAYTKMGKNVEAREDLLQALELSTDKSEQASIKKALQDVKEMEEVNRKREREMSQKMFKFPETKKVEKKLEPESTTDNLKAEELK